MVLKFLGELNLVNVHNMNHTASLLEPDYRQACRRLKKQKGLPGSQVQQHAEQEFFRSHN